MSKLAFTVAGASKATGIPERVLITAVNQRDLTARRVDGRAILLASDLQDWLEEQPSYL